MNIKKALNNERIMKAVIGMGKKEFNKLLMVFGPIVSRVKYKRNRKRKAGAGRKHTLRTPEEKLFYMLFYMKCYPTFDVAAFFYGVDKSQCKRWVDELRVALEKALGKEMVLPERRIGSVKEFIERFPEVNELLIDGTERPIQRPQEENRQRACYSGKKKRHTEKNIIATNCQKEVLFLSSTCGGKEHDLTVLKKSHLLEHIPGFIKIYADLGFKGLEKKDGVKVYIPYRKGRGKELTEAQKTFNRDLKKYRVTVENSISGIKRLRCITDVSRIRKEEIRDHLMWLSCGLWNFHLKAC